MTKQEFQSRVGMIVFDNEFTHINEVYMNSDVDKDEFCKLWVKMNRNRVRDFKEKLRKENEKYDLLSHLHDLTNRYIYKGHEEVMYEPAYKHLTKKEKSVLDKVGIDYIMNEFNIVKSLVSVIYEVRQFNEIA